MATNKTTSDIISWFKEVISPRIKNQLEIIPHGGTALALRGLKGSTKDVDFNITEREWFDEFCKIMESLNYEKDMDFMPRGQEEHLIRYTSDKYAVDIVDIHYPTWNNWLITETVKKRAEILRFEKLIVIVPDSETIFLFKTYPCRSTDILDLDQILTKESPNVKKIKELFNDQETQLHSNENIDPVISIVNLRTRFYLSLKALKKNHGSIRKLYEFALKKFRVLDIGIDVERLETMIGAQDDIKWEKFIEKNYKKFAKALGTP